MFFKMRKHLDSTAAEHLLLLADLTYVARCAVVLMIYGTKLMMQSKCPGCCSIMPHIHMQILKTYIFASP